MAEPVEPKELIEKLIKDRDDILKWSNELSVRLTSFFYSLMRDRLPVGEVNELLKDCLTNAELVFSDNILAAKASSLAMQMIEGEYRVKEEEILTERAFLKLRRDQIAEFDLKGWMNKHTNATPGGPIEPPKPIETDAKIETA